MRKRTDDALGALDAMAVAVVAEGVADQTQSLSVRIEVSPDGRNWTCKSAATEPAPPFDAAGTTAESEADAAPVARTTIGLTQHHARSGDARPPAHLTVWLLEPTVLGCDPCAEGDEHGSHR